jgi:type 1 glutamine amidotransferase
MKKYRIFISGVLTLVMLSLSFVSCQQKPGLKALILTGQSDHNWISSSWRLKTIVEKSGVFTVDMKISPQKGQDMSGFIINFKPYDVVVLDYMGDNWPASTQKDFVDYVRDGGGVVVCHDANNAFPYWPEYKEIIGLGWGRDGDFREFAVKASKPGHPILKGLPENWLHVQDELITGLRGSAENMEILAYARSGRTFNGEYSNEPVLMTTTYGKGRIFHTVLGHTGKELFPPSMECAGYVTTLQRGAEWAATGRVTQEVPKAFPTETKCLQWEFYEDIYSDITSVVKRMEHYEIGKSNDCFNILKKLMAGNMDNQEKTAEYHRIIRELLNSRKSTIECRKVLLKEFSWMADDSYREVYGKLKQNPKLAAEARYALDMIGN